MTMTSSSDKIKSFNEVPVTPASMRKKKGPIDTFVRYIINADQHNTGEIARFTAEEAQNKVNREVAVIIGPVPGTELAKKVEEEMKRKQSKKDDQKSSKEKDKQITPGDDKESLGRKIKKMVTK